MSVDLDKIGKGIHRHISEQDFQSGVIAERKRIIKLLKDESRQCEKAGLWANGTELRSQLQELHLGLNAAIAIIKGENK
jgi:hypothetical protein